MWVSGAAAAGRAAAAEQPQEPKPFYTFTHTRQVMGIFQDRAEEGELGSFNRKLIWSPTFADKEVGGFHTPV